MGSHLSVWEVADTWFGDQVARKVREPNGSEDHIGKLCLAKKTGIVRVSIWIAGCSFGVGLKREICNNLTLS